MAEERRVSALSKKRIIWAALGALLAAHLILAYLLFDPKPFVGGDNAGYMILGESLSSGQGYRDIHLPGAPRHAQYPPVYPALLALVGALGGGLIAWKALSALFTAASVVFLFLLARARLGQEGGLAVAAAFALNPVLLYYSHWVLSEPLFVLLTLAALWASERLEVSRRWLLLALAAASLAYLTRAAGLPTLLALLVALAWHRHWRRLAAAGGAILGVVVGWWAWGRLAARESARIYAGNFLLVDPYVPESGYIGPGDLLARTVNNLRIYAVEVLPESLAGAAPGGGVNLAALLVGLLIIALALVAWVRNLRRGRTLEWFTALYAALIFAWPEVWTDRRFLLPLLPVLLLHAASGIAWSFDFLRARRSRWAFAVFAGLLVLLATPDHVRAAGFSQRCAWLQRQGDDLACYPPPWRAFAEAAYWVRDNTLEDAIVISRKPRLFYYYARRRGDVYPFTSDEADMLAFLDRSGADYLVVVAALSETTYRYLLPVIRDLPEQFEIVYAVEGSVPAYVLAYRSAAPGAAGERG